MPQQALGGSSFIHEHVIQPAALLNSTEVEKLAHKEGTRRTVYFTKQVDDPNKKTSGEGAYRRTGQYLGEWHANEFDGKGVYELANGTRYVGGWQAGKRHGMGTTWLKGKKGELRKQYAGQWLDDARHGRGVFNYKNGDSYNGEWKNGVRHGVGILTLAGDGGVYEGEWFNDKRHGFGVFDYKNGDHFEGAWVEGLKEGEGVHFYFDKEKKAHTKRCEPTRPASPPPPRRRPPRRRRRHRPAAARPPHAPPSPPPLLRRYDGEWVDDSPKCGFYTEMPPDPAVPASSEPDPLPPTTLRDADGVIASRLREIRDARAHHRAERVPLDEHFTAEELEALQVAFSRVDEAGAGALDLDQMRSAFLQVGMEPTDEEIAMVLEQLEKSDDGDATFSFAEFSQACDFLAPLE
jgi:hypothetical protein